VSCGRAARCGESAAVTAERLAKQCYYTMSRVLAEGGVTVAAAAAAAALAVVAYKINSYHQENTHASTQTDTAAGRQRRTVTEIRRQTNGRTEEQSKGETSQ